MLSFCEDVYIITLKYHIQILPPLNSNLGSAIGFKYVFVRRTKNLVPPLFFMTHESFAIDCLC